MITLDSTISANSDCISIASTYESELASYMPRSSVGEGRLVKLLFDEQFLSIKLILKRTPHWAELGGYPQLYCTVEFGANEG